MSYSILADIVLITHALFVFFIVGGLVLIFSGAGFGWNWIKHFWFRATHLAAIFIVTLQSWLNIICPLTTLETYFRKMTGQPSYQKTFVAHWLHELLFYEAPMWVFTLCYTLFGLSVLAAWVFIPPSVPWNKKSRNHQG